MADKSNIEWTDASWTPIRARYKNPLGQTKLGWHCEHVSPGCENCYSGEMNERRFGTGLPFKPGHRKDVDIFLDEKMLLAPLKWKRPRKIFVCSMTDLFGEFVPDEWIDKLFAVMALCPQHTFQVLTKRSKRMREYMTASGLQSRLADAANEFWLAHKKASMVLLKFSIDVPGKVTVGTVTAFTQFPFPHVWLGVSCEDQTRADERIPDLLATPAAVRFVSAEPLLGPIDFNKLNWIGGRKIDALSSYTSTPLAAPGYWQHEPNDMPKLDWIIIGGESGLNARPMHPDWAGSIRDQCAAAGTAFFFKQWGEWTPGENAKYAPTRTERTAEWWNHEWHFGTLTPKQSDELRGEDDPDLYRIGKKRAGHRLDGVEHQEFPKAGR